MPETHEQRVFRKAGEIRAALIASGTVHSPDPDMKFEDLPYSRQQRWLAVADVYAVQFPGR